MGPFIKWYCKQIGKSKLVKANLEGKAYKIVRPFDKNIISLQFQMEECHLLLIDQIDLMNPEGNRVVQNISKPLPLGGPPGDKERRHALSISKMKAACYPDFGLKELVPSLWIESEHDYDISAAYGISHYLKTFSRYGYTYLKEIVLRRADYKEYKISKADFKNLHPSDFEALHLLNLQEKLDFIVKDHELFKFNPGMKSRIWTKDDKQRSQEFIKLIERRLKIRRIFRSLESFVRDG
ncbi:hypothetical protein Tco_0793737 [Tanacetum coccineum]